MSSELNLNLESEYLSEEARRSLEEEFEALTTRKRKEISERLEESSSLGDLSENAEYQEAKEQQLMNERRIAEVEDLLSRTVVISQRRKNRARTELGCTVVFKKISTKEIYKYQIVGSEEADPALKKISKESPLGCCLLNKKIGARLEVVTPAGKIRYTIIDII